MMFARLDFRRFLVCCSGDIYYDESEEKPSVAICGGSICVLTGLTRNSRGNCKLLRSGANEQEWNGVGIVISK